MSPAMASSPRRPPLHGEITCPHVGRQPADFAIRSQRDNHYTTRARDAGCPAKAHSIRSV
eukprot:1783946-Prymnesium_polylepis.1